MWFTDMAIEQGIKTSDVYADAAPLSAAALGIGLEWLKNARRYRIELPLIPHGAEERREASLEAYGHGLAAPLPWKWMLFEYEHGGAYVTEPDLTRALATKRIALCVDLESVCAVSVAGLENFERAPDDMGGILVWPITYFDEKRDWEFAAAAAIIPRHGALEYVTECARRKSLGERVRALFGLDLPDAPETSLRVTFQEMLPEIADRLADEDRQRMYADTVMDAAWVVLGSLAAMRCENVSVDDASGTLAVRLDRDDATGVPLDPFHGRRQSNRTGSAWVQDSRTSFP